jgi:hypothetical protein
LDHSKLGALVGEDCDEGGDQLVAEVVQLPARDWPSDCFRALLVSSFRAARDPLQFGDLVPEGYVGVAWAAWRGPRTTWRRSPSVSKRARKEAERLLAELGIPPWRLGPEPARVSYRQRMIPDKRDEAREDRRQQQRHAGQQHRFLPRHRLVILLDRYVASAMLLKRT